MLTTFLTKIDELKPTVAFRLFLASLTLSLGFNVALWLLVSRQVQYLPADIPLHYNIYFGIDWFGDKHKLFFLPILGAAIWLVNFSLGFYYITRRQLFCYFLIFSSVFVQIILLLAGLAILLLNV